MLISASNRGFNPFFINFVILKKRFKYFFAVAVFAYLLSNIGIPVYYHYCGGELESVSALFNNNGCCGDDAEEEDSDCCKNETKVIAQLSESFFKVTDYNISPPLNDLCYLNFIQFPKLNNIEPADIKRSAQFKIPITGRDILQDKSILII